MAGGKGLWRVFTWNLVGADQFGRWSEAKINEIGKNLADLFSEVLKMPTCPYTKVEWYPGHPGLALDPGEVLVYFVTKRSSIALASGAPYLGPGGTTWTIPAGTISEVYVETFLSNARYETQAAKLVFHEAMHNKIDPSGSDKNIHELDGTGLATGGAIGPDTPLTLKNRQLMAANMARKMPQFLAPVSGITLTDGMPTSINGRDPSRP